MSPLQVLVGLFILFQIHQSNAFVLVGSGGGAFGGLSVTPVAQIDTGVMAAQYQNRVIGTGRYEGLNLTNVYGLADFLEVGGRIATNTTNVNLFMADGGIRDLSASFKFQINPILNLNKFPLRVALGVSDFGGAATKFRSYYGVASYALNQGQVSFGFADAGQNNLSFNPLNGVFANGTYAVKPWLNLHLETTSKNTWASFGIHDATTLPSWGAPKGTTAFMRINTQVRGINIVGGKPWVDLGLRVPLDWTEIKSNKPSNIGTLSTPTLQQHAQYSVYIPTGTHHASQSYEPLVVKSIAPQPKGTNSPSQTLASDPKESLGSYIQALSDNLLQSGLEGVSIGIVGDMLVVKASDMVYEHSLLDGAGVVLGQIAQNLPKQINQYRYIHARWGTPAIGFTGDVSCLKDWLDRGNKCYPIDAVQVVFRDLQRWTDSVNWIITQRQDYRFKPRVKVNPVQNYYVATDHALLDYSVGVQIQPSMILWDGGLLEASNVNHIKSTLGYNSGEIFNFTRVRDSFNGLMLTHIQKFSSGFSGRFNLGQIGTGFYKGGHAELRWDSLEGEWATGLNQGYWKSSEPVLQTVGHPTSIYARYAPSHRDWSLEVIAGRYWYGDKGLSLISNHWMGDVKVSLFFRRSVPPERFWPGKYSATFAGLDVSFPLTPRRSMNNEYFQVKGTSRMGLSLSTPVGRTDNNIVDPFGIPIYVKALVDSPVAAHLGSVLMD